MGVPAGCSVADKRAQQPGLAALGMALINPNLPWDAVFSFTAATLGLVLYAQPWKSGLFSSARRISKKKPKSGGSKG